MFNKADEVTQRERREVMRNDRRVREAAAYHSVAQGSVDDERGGRYATEGSKQTVIGSSPISYPTQPEHSPWRRDPVPDEGPLGFSVDAHEAVGEMFEQSASESRLVMSPVADGVGGGSRDGTSSRPTIQRFVRRF